MIIHSHHSNTFVILKEKEKTNFTDHLWWSQIETKIRKSILCLDKALLLKCFASAKFFIKVECVKSLGKWGKSPRESNYEDE